MADDLKTLTRRARELKAAGRLDAAVELYRRAVTDHPGNAVAEHNLGAALGDAGDHEAAQRHLRNALMKGSNAPETWLALARSELALGRFGDSERAYLEALTRRPLPDAHHELAQLRWMRSGDREAALEAIDRSLAAEPGHGPLHRVRAGILEYTGDLQAAYEGLAAALRQWPAEPALLVPAAHLAVRIGQVNAALAHARRAVARAPDDRECLGALAYACLAAGNATEAVGIAEALRAAYPFDQHAITLLATAWRLQDDARYRQLCDYAELVRAYAIEAPAGWSNLNGYLADLASALTSLHPYRSHPFGQSVRHGSQIPDVTRSRHPAIRAFPEAIAGAIDAHLRALGPGDDPLRARNTGRWRIHGIWSVRLAAGGFHSDHVHPDGWLSSACYIELPPSLGDADHTGWIKFGEPGMPTRPALGPEHHVRPEPGRLVLFPSYMWHGTLPHRGDGARMTIAFDIVPD